MSKKITISVPNKVRPNLVVLFHEYLSRKAKEHSTHIEPYIFDDYEDMADYWDQMFPGWDKDIPNDDDDGDVVFPPSNVIVMSPKNGKNKKRDDRTIYDAFWRMRREERWNNDKKKKCKHSKGKKGAKTIEIDVPYSGEEENPTEYDFGDVSLYDTEYDNEVKEIWFYPDYHCKDDRLEFNSLKEFSDYCDRMGYYVDSDVESKIEWHYENHCCLNPTAERKGVLEIMSENTYGELFYEACDERI